MLVDMPTRSVLEDLENLFERPTRFLGFLESLTDGGWAGLRCNAFGCPFALFTKEALGYYAVEVTGKEILVWTTPPSIGAPAVVFQIPSWGKAFVNVIDSVDTRRESVSKHEAVQAMYKIMYYLDADNGEIVSHGA